MIKVLSCSSVKGEWFITVESHDFYIDGKGGQLGDTGTIGDVKFIKILNDKTLQIDRYLEEGEYSFSIDTNRIKDISVQHTAQHLFSAIAYNDYNFNTVGFRMGEKYTTVDLDSKDIDDKLILELEKKVNSAITSKHEINISIVTREEANKIDTFRKQISDKVMGNVRIVEIKGLDMGTCAGYHVENTGDIKIFKILHFEKIKGNYTRIYFVAGDRAINDYIFKNNLILNLNKEFSCRDYEILNMLDKNKSEKIELENELKSITNKYCELLKENLTSYITEKNGVKYVLLKDNINVINELVKLIPEEFTFIGIWNKGGLISSKSINCNLFIKKLSNVLNIKGGGKEERGNFKGELTLDEIINLL